MGWWFFLLFAQLGALSVEETIQLAFEKNPQIFIPYYEIQLKEGLLEQATAWPNPNLSYQIRWGINGATAPKIDGALLSPITEWLALPLDKKVALNGVFQSWVETYRASIDLAIEVERLYYKTFAYRKQVEWAKKRAQLDQIRFDLRQKQNEAGNIFPLDALSANAMWIESEQEVQSYQERYLRAKAELTELVGIEIEPEEPHDLFVVRIDPERAVQIHPEIEKLRWQAEIDRAKLAAQPWWRFLNLSLGATYERETDNTKLLGPGIDMAIPLFRYGAPERLIARIQIQIDCLKIAADEIRVEAQVKQLTLQGDATLKAIKQAYEALEIIDESLNQGQTYYNVMNLSPYTLMATYDQKIEAELNRIDLKVRLLDQMLDLEKIAGEHLFREIVTIEPNEQAKKENRTVQIQATHQSSKLSIPNGSVLPFIEKDGVKEFHLIAEPVLQSFAPGFVAEVWGYNGSSPGPVIEAYEGDQVRILVTNNLPEITTVHWHGLILPWQMDGVVGLSQPPIKPGETYTYEFTLNQNGTYMYHSHADEMTQIALGMFGFFIIHPKKEDHPVDHDFLIFLHEWLIPPGASRPDPFSMTDFNYFTFNGRVYPGTEKLKAKKGEKIRIRLANLSMNNHPIHLHGHEFTVVRRGAKRLNESAQYTENTVDVPPGGTRDIEFVANPGLWALHCHKTHHVFNGMNHDFPNLVGVNQKEIRQKLEPFFPGFMGMGSDGMAEMFSEHHQHLKRPPNFLPYGNPGPFGTIEMGGMFTILEVDE